MQSLSIMRVMRGHTNYVSDINELADPHVCNMACSHGPNQDVGGVADNAGLEGEVWIAPPPPTTTPGGGNGIEPPPAIQPNQPGPHPHYPQITDAFPLPGTPAAEAVGLVPIGIRAREDTAPERPVKWHPWVAAPVEPDSDNSVSLKGDWLTCVNYLGWSPHG